jgi:hypothetical protein
MGKYQMIAIMQLNCHDILSGIFIEGKQAAFNGKMRISGDLTTFELSNT